MFGDEEQVTYYVKFSSGFDNCFVAYWHIQFESGLPVVELLIHEIYGELKAHLTRCWRTISNAWPSFKHLILGLVISWQLQDIGKSLLQSCYTCFAYNYCWCLNLFFCHACQTFVGV